MAVDPEDARKKNIAKNLAAVNIAPIIWKVGSPDAVEAAAKIKTTLTNTLNEPPRTSLDNPPFIFPGPTIKIATTGQTYRPKRGYIRRLNEFYSKMGPEAASITGRRCNFQFQPETIVRTVEAQTTDTQFFFNQDPAQLTVPIPGQSNYSITLMFNREAEVASGKFIPGSLGVLSQSKNLRSPKELEFNVSKFITGDYQPEWVCSIGVLADIMVLDGVIGQGISTETIKILNTINTTQAAETAKDSTATAEQIKQAQDVLDKEKEKVDYWMQDAATNPNLGNTAFLVPTPVRIMMSNMMMIEGFILRSSVNFHKFSKNYIPTQCRVDLTVQALYIGFAKDQTMLTLNTKSLSSGGSGPDEETVEEKDKNIREATQDGVNNFFSVLGSFTAPSAQVPPLKDTIFLNATGSFLGSFLTDLTDAGEEFYKKYTIENGGEVTWFWEAKIKMFWKYIEQGDNLAARVTGVIARPGGSVLREVVPSDFLGNGQLANLTDWGTPSAPLGIQASGRIHSKTQSTRGKGVVTTWVVASASDEDTKATWSFTTPTSSTYKRPFTTEQFNIQFELTISAERYGSDYVSKQKFTTDEIVTVNASMLTKKLKAT